MHKRSATDVIEACRLITTLHQYNWLTVATADSYIVSRESACCLVDIELLNSTWSLELLPAQHRVSELYGLLHSYSTW